MDPLCQKSQTHANREGEIFVGFTEFRPRARNPTSCLPGVAALVVVVDVVVSLVGSVVLYLMYLAGCIWDSGSRVEGARV